MTDLERAMADIAFIQQRLAASTRFDGLTPQAVAGTGLLALAAAFVKRTGRYYSQGRLSLISLSGRSWR